jgi:DNA-binding LacI/PurR family transcriptional regulator
MATRSDVARMANVSESTVSYVLSGVRPISSEVRQRVEAAMKELSYTPHAFGRGLASKRTGILAVHYPVGERGITLTALEYIVAATEQARRQGSHLLLWTGPIDDLDELRRLTGQGLVDGVLLMEIWAHDERVNVLETAHVPFVLIGRTENPQTASYVDADFVSMGRQAIRHVVGLGHEVVAFVSQSAAPSERGYGPTDRVERAVRAEASAAGVRLVTVSARTTMRSGQAAFAEIMSQRPDTTAILGMNEQALVGVMNAAAGAGCAIPDDLTVVSLCIGAGTAAELTIPAMTTVAPRGEVIGALAIDHLLAIIDDRAAGPLQDLVDSELISRGSSGPARRRARDR